MAHEQKTKAMDFGDAAPAAPAAPATAPDGWDPNPIVLVSKRIRIFSFPQDLLLGPVDAEIRKAWRKPESRAGDRGEISVTINAGVTFLGNRTSAWALRKIDDPGRAPRTASGEPVAPPDNDCVILYPDMSARDVLRGQEFRLPETDQLRSGKIHDAMLRVLSYWQEIDAEVVAKGKPGLWKSNHGYDAPELILCRLNELLHQNTPLGQKAYSHVRGSIRTYRETRHLGALHDYAVRAPASWVLVEDCRSRARVLKPETL